MLQVLTGSNPTLFQLFVGNILKQWGYGPTYVLYIAPAYTCMCFYCNSASTCISWSSTLSKILDRHSIPVRCQSSLLWLWLLWLIHCVYNHKFILVHIHSIELRNRGVYALLLQDWIEHSPVYQVKLVSWQSLFLMIKNVSLCRGSFWVHFTESVFFLYDTHHLRRPLGVHSMRRYTVSLCPLKCISMATTRSTVYMYCLFCPFTLH